MVAKRKTLKKSKVAAKKSPKKAKAKKKPVKTKKSLTKKKKVAKKVKKIKKKTKSKSSVSSKVGKKPLKFVRKVKDLRSALAKVRARNRSVALVPTMGYLHEGHLSLVRKAKEMASFVVGSVFINPTQFGPNEDLDRYPRDMAGDRRKLRQAGADLMFVPDEREIYPEGFQTYVDVTDVTKDYTGISRPGHFRGVTTVVTKLINIVKPDVIIFGEKDYQQLVAISQMVKDLNVDVQVVGMPTIREEDGIAMSSRNAYLSPAQRLQATAIYRGLRKAKKLLDSGERDAAELAAIVIDLLREEHDIEIDYVVVCDPNTLERIPEVERSAVLLVAVKVGDTYLIDNIRLEVRRRR
jgi:pantoate--beta-alanine ligase